jgi:hypothetical protein
MGHSSKLFLMTTTHVIHVIIQLPLNRMSIAEGRVFGFNSSRNGPRNVCPKVTQKYSHFTAATGIA